MNSVSVAAAAQTLVERVATNVGAELCSMLDMVAQELAECVRIYGLDSRTGTYRPIAAEDLRHGALFQDGAAVLTTPDGATFTLMTVHRADFAAYLAKLDQMDSGAWDADKATAA
jgi:hypothetical protein